MLGVKAMAIEPQTSTGRVLQTSLRACIVADWTYWFESDVTRTTSTVKLWTRRVTARYQSLAARDGPDIARLLETERPSAGGRYKARSLSMADDVTKCGVVVDRRELSLRKIDEVERR